MIETICFWGDTGTGKTSAANLIDPDLYEVDPPVGHSGTPWFDGYEGHKTLLIDEYRGWIQWVFLKRLLDPWYPLKKLPVKGSYPKAAYTKVLICSNTHPLRWHPQKVLKDMRQLTRRIHKAWFCEFDKFSLVDLDGLLDELITQFGENAQLPSTHVL